MGVLDSVARSVASSMVGKFGQTVILQEKQTGAYAPSTTSVAVAKFEHEVSAIVSDYAEYQVQGLIKSGDKKVLIAAKDLPRTPTVDWTIKIGERWFEIRHVKTVYSGDEQAMHELVARGA